MLNNEKWSDFDEKGKNKIDNLGYKWQEK